VIFGGQEKVFPQAYLIADFIADYNPSFQFRLFIHALRVMYAMCIMIITYMYIYIY